MHAAVMRKNAAERYRGRETSMERRSPVTIGAMIPASLESAEAIPHAVPLHDQTRDQSMS